MSGHTRGRLHMQASPEKRFGDLGLYVVKGSHPNGIEINGGVGIPYLVATVRGEGFYKAGAERERDANATRLALCWNTLASLDNETVERLAAYLDQHNNDTVADMLREEGF